MPEPQVQIQDYSNYTVQQAWEHSHPDLHLQIFEDASSSTGTPPTTAQMSLKISQNHPASPPGTMRDVGGTVGVILMGTKSF